MQLERLLYQNQGKIPEKYKGLLVRFKIDNFVYSLPDR
jgi:hypothetical protein